MPYAARSDETPVPSGKFRAPDIVFVNWRDMLSGNAQLSRADKRAFEAAIAKYLEQPQIVITRPDQIRIE